MPFDTFLTLVKNSPTPYLGRLPDEIARLFGSSAHQKAFLHQLDRLALAVQQAFQDKRGCPTLMDLPISDDLTLTAQWIRSGSMAKIYNLNLNGQELILKVFTEPKEVMLNRHGNWIEQQVGLYLSRQRFKNLSTYYLGNPKAGWILYEKIPNGVDVDARPGDDLREYPVRLFDDKDTNSIRGAQGQTVRVDHGGIVIETDRPFNRLPGHRAIRTFSA